MIMMEILFRLLRLTLRNLLKNKFFERNPEFEVSFNKQFTQSHDRFLIIDGGKEVYHIGASLKDLSKKWFAFSKMDKISVDGIISAVVGLI